MATNKMAVARRINRKRAVNDIKYEINQSISAGTGVAVQRTDIIDARQRFVETV